MPDIAEMAEIDCCEYVVIDDHLRKNIMISVNAST